MDFNRKETETLPLILPKEFCDEIKNGLLKIYGDHCIKDDKTFEVYAYSYPTEVVLLTSYVGLNKEILPITLFLSADIKDENPSEMLESLYDAIGIFFDQYFISQTAQGLDDQNQNDLFEYVYEWEEFEFNHKTFHFKITRENIGLTIKADELLKNI